MWRWPLSPLYRRFIFAASTHLLQTTHVVGLVDPAAAGKDAATRTQSRVPQRVWPADGRRGSARSPDSRMNEISALDRSATTQPKEGYL